MAQRFSSSRSKEDTIPHNAVPLWLLDEMSYPLLVLTESVEEASRHIASWKLFAPNLKVLFLPDWETLPYEHLSAHKDLISERLSVLWQVSQGMFDVLVIPVATAMQKLSPISFVTGRTFFLRVGQRLDVNLLRQNLISAGYTLVGNVVSAGEFAVRGSLLDLFPMGEEVPFRIDLFDNEIDSIKTFDPDTQRSIETVNEIRLLPAYEFPTDSDAQSIFRQNFREILEGDPSSAIPYKQVSKGLFGSGVEYYLPLFFEEECVPFTKYLPENTHVISLVDIESVAQNFSQDIHNRFTYAQGEDGYPPLPPNYLYLNPQGLQDALREFPRIFISGKKIDKYSLPEIAVDRKKEQPLELLINFQNSFTQKNNGRILICAQSAGRRETMLSFLKRQGLSPKVVDSWQEFINSDIACGLVVSELSKGFIGQDKKIAVISENDLYPSSVKSNIHRKHKRFSTSSDMVLRDLAEIRLGDLVVHENHGIARYAGLMNLNLGYGDEEMLVLEYANDEKLYVPVSQLHVISRYAGISHENVSLHSLGSNVWQKAKRRATQKAHDTAAELLHLYAQRELVSRQTFILDETEYGAFADGFEYNETEDQAAAIAAVIKDLLSPQPMDRLVCGDVGFGKTEVALRAAFIAVMSGKQVAVLAPTTLLVEQHTQVFMQRFANFPVKIASLSRFNAGRETKQSLQGISDGTVDIVIGTHKLVQPDIQFKDLGLIIIDEEHRFGVRQKEKLKQLRANVDVLTLTATPIPRTLSMSLEGLRDLSLITTAPEKRLAVKTFVKPFSDARVREAMLRELKRGGQVFFLHNEVDTIENMKEKLEKLMPEARIAVAHGQLPPQQLERVMREFLRQQFNVLLCSTIIETGIDIPNANTIIINRADKFGIAQLHQLRGRVGRSHHQAYAYLLTPEYIGRDAQKRLDAIAAADELGAGFMLAMEDLEIRGAGEILGEGQSGDITQIGLTLYSEMLKQAVRDLKNGRIPDFEEPMDNVVEIKLNSPALLPDSYCADIHERLILYKRLSACETDEKIDDIYEELVDRFGLPPEMEDGKNPVKTLLASHRLRLLAQKYGFSVVSISDNDILLTFGKYHQIDPVNIINLLQNNRNWAFAGKNRLKISISSPTLDDKVRNVKEIFNRLINPV
ncbi:MAG: transcription-repair coupling factor [Neisseriaceae bacterium]|nr:transcription-repair coupling factor [Neisseriaceae bacterium]